MLGEITEDCPYINHVRYYTAFCIFIINYSK